MYLPRKSVTAVKLLTLCVGYEYRVSWVSVLPRLLFHNNDQYIKVEKVQNRWETKRKKEHFRRSLLHASPCPHHTEDGRWSVLSFFFFILSLGYRLVFCLPVASRRGGYTIVFSLRYIYIFLNYWLKQRKNNSTEWTVQLLLPHWCSHIKRERRKRNFGQCVVAASVTPKVAGTLSGWHSSW